MFKYISSREVPISGPLLQEKAPLLTKDFKNEEFKVLNGWLEVFLRDTILHLSQKAENLEPSQNIRILYDVWFLRY